VAPLFFSALDKLGTSVAILVARWGEQQTLVFCPLLWVLTVTIFWLGLDSNGLLAARLQKWYWLTFLDVAIESRRFDVL